MANRQTGIAEVIGAASLLLVYLATMPPSLTWAHYGADGGDLVTAVARGSIAHPPGFPAYLLLGELFIRLPWGEPAWRLNLMSAVLAAVATGLMVAAVWLRLQSAVGNRPTGSPSLQSAVGAALSLGLAPLFWSQALITEVYALAAFFTVLILYLALRGGSTWALVLVWGVGAGAHPILLLLVPLVFWQTWQKGGRRLLRMTQVSLLALLGWGIMYGPVLLARSSVPSPWGDVSTPTGWWALVSGQLYHGYIFGLPLDAWPQRLLAWAGLLTRQFTPLGAILAGLGWLRLWREWRALAGATAIAFGTISFYAIGYNTSDSFVYLVVALPLAALWLGEGLSATAIWLKERLPWGAWLVLLLPALQLFLFWGEMDIHQDRVAMNWAEQVLRKAPPQAILLTTQDAHTFTLWYVHDVLGKRSDVVVVDPDLWSEESYRRMMSQILALDITSLSPEEAVRRAGRPVVRVDDFSLEDP